MKPSGQLAGAQNPFPSLFANIKFPNFVPVNVILSLSDNTTVYFVPLSTFTSKLPAFTSSIGLLFLSSNTHTSSHSVLGFLSNLSSAYTWSMNNV